MCNNYHLYNRYYNFKLALQYYFPNASESVIYEMYKLSVGNIEREMRCYYEKLYIKNPDSSHSHFVNNILPKSFTYNDDFTLRGNKFWKVVLYVSGLEIYKNQYPDIARARLNAILDYEIVNTKTCNNRARDIQQILHCDSNIHYTDNELYNFFQNFLYLNKYNYNTNDVEFYNFYQDFIYLNKYNYKYRNVKMNI